MKNPGLSRRDFANGCALSLVAGSTISPLDAIAQNMLDPAASPHTDAAIGEAFRAVNELIGSA